MLYYRRCRRPAASRGRVVRATFSPYVAGCFKTMVMLSADCPFHIVDKARELASELEVGPIPLDFDPGDLLWREILALLAEEFSNHGELRKRLDGFPDAETDGRCERCQVLEEWGGDDVADCSERFLAEHELWTAAVRTAERAYQRWLARRLIRRASAEGP